MKKWWVTQYYIQELFVSDIWKRYGAKIFVLALKSTYVKMYLNCNIRASFIWRHFNYILVCRAEINDFFEPVVLWDHFPPLWSKVILWLELSLLWLRKTHGKHSESLFQQHFPQIQILWHTLIYSSCWGTASHYIRLTSCFSVVWPASIHWPVTVFLSIVSTLLNFLFVLCQSQAISIHVKEQ